MKIKNFAYLAVGILGLLFLSGFLMLNQGTLERVGFFETYFALFVIAYCFYKGVDFQRKRE
ncbi:hypothetical protein AB8I23_004206 [Vibrio alginolyticus]|nr:hypothetical protein [Vibrio parahaemolyticus]EJC7127700.1 hypothetical protein [Vibrio parahaemolyticus]